MKSKSKIIILGLSLSVLLTANFASASLVGCTNNCTINDLISTIDHLINFLLTYAWLVSILFIVWSGLQMMFAAGNEERITQAKTSLTHAIIGFIIILVAFVIINFVIALLTGGGGFNVNAIQGAFQLIP